MEVLVADIINLDGKLNQKFFELRDSIIKEEQSYTNKQILKGLDLIVDYYDYRVEHKLAYNNSNLTSKQLKFYVIATDKIIY